MNLLKIKQAILALDNSELRELNSYVVDRSKQLGREKKTEFYIGQKIECQGSIFTISKLNRSKAKCIKDTTGERYNIPFQMMSEA
tara:strand:- start:45 stop:299 length:255 start_codon:yes stop_codon:yes gene_type:complete